MEINTTLLKRYFSGRCTPEEEKVVLDYLSNQDNDPGALYTLLEQEQQEVAPREIPPALLRSLAYGLRQHTYPGFLKPAKVVSWRWWYAAAAILLPVVLFLTLYVPGKKRAAGPAAVTLAQVWETITNETNATRKAFLPDGSHIWLTARSSFSYMPAAYGVDKRLIRLEGEGFFDVVRDSLHPFIVQHGAISTRVLGTAFNVESYAGEEQIRVSLVRGKVMITATGDTAFRQPLRYLNAGEQLLYHQRDRVIQVKPLLHADETTWTKGWMVLDNVPLTAALKRLERRYGLQIVVPEGLVLTGKNVTAVFKGGTPQEILGNILFAHRLSFREKNKVFHIQNAAR